MALPSEEGHSEDGRPAVEIVHGPYTLCPKLGLKVEGPSRRDNCSGENKDEAHDSSDALCSVILN